MKTYMTFGALLAGLGAAALSGCGEGAYEPSNVVLRPSKSTTAVATTANGQTEAPAGENGAAQPAAAAGGYGAVKGRVVLVGGAPNLPPLVQKGANVKDGQVCAVNAVPNQKYVVGPDGGLANVYIYLTKAPANGKPTAGHEPDSQVFTQQGCVFIPHAMVLRAGKPFTITSDDVVPHNVHSKPKRQSDINQIVEKGQKLEVAYEKPEPEPCSVGCDFHTWMIAYHLPLDHPYGVVTDENGNFEIQDLPVGTHNFRIWHEGKVVNAGYPIKVTKDGATEEVNIELPIALLQ